MANCPKCRVSVEQPVKTWKIKQTPIALYECPSCKVRWRNKRIVEAAVVTPINPPETATAGRIEVETPIPLVSNVAAVPKPSASPFSGLRRFFSSILNL